MFRLPIVVGMVMLGLALLVGTGASQDKKEKDQPKKSQLPAGFKDLGLSKDQIAKIHSIQTDHRAKIAEYDAKIKELKKTETQEVFKVLTDDQRTKYLKAKGVDLPSKDVRKTDLPAKDAKKDEVKKDDKK